MPKKQFSYDESNTPHKIELRNLKSFSSGYHRDSYLHPHDTGKILKITRRQPQQVREGIFGLRRGVAIDPNQLEYDMWQKLKANGHDKSGYFSQVYGWLDTDIGRALCVERLVSDLDFPPIVLKTLNANKSKQLDQELKQFILSSIDEFFEYVVNHTIYSCAWRLENIAICRQNGQFVLKSFDTKEITVREWVPVSRYFRSVLRRKIRRRTGKLRDHLRSVL